MRIMENISPLADSAMITGRRWALILRIGGLLDRLRRHRSLAKGRCTSRTSESASFDDVASAKYHCSVDNSSCPDRLS